MAYKALYRTYRPSTFDEVAGQQHIVKTIKNALATGKIAHAYLFAGPRGTGKTTMAKLLAKALNCEEGIGHQCNECKNCKAILEGSHPDVLEIDAASNNGVDEVRDLIDRVKYGTILGKYKVYIIDEVHMMTTGAFNALLKTLEEPPEHVIFILATTEPHKILPTILSRCQRYDFTKVSDKDIKERLKVVLENENIRFNEEAVDLIISLADGGMRDALSLLDQVLAYSGGELNTEDVLNIFALESVDEKLALLSSIFDGEVGDVLTRLNKYIAKGTDIKRLTNDLLLILKDLLLYNTPKGSNYMEVLLPSQASSIIDRVKEKDILKMIDALMDALKDYKNVTSINPLFEITLLKLTTMSNSSKEKQTTVLEKEQVQQVVPPTPIIFKQPEPVTKQENKVSVFDQDIVLSEKVIEPVGVFKDTGYAIDDDLMLKIMVTSKKEIKNGLLEKWGQLNRYAAHPIFGKEASQLIDGHVLLAGPKIIILELQLPKSAERFNTVTNQKNVQNIIENAFGTRMFVYAVSRVESVNIQNKYKNLKEVGKLPKPENINIEFQGE